MNTTLTEHSVLVAARTDIRRRDRQRARRWCYCTAADPALPGLSNYSRNIEPLARQFRVVVPDMPGLRPLRQGCRPAATRSATWPTQSAGYSTNWASASAHVVGNSYGGAAALRLALDTPDRVSKLVLMGPGGIGTTRSVPTAGLKSLLSYYGGGGPSREKLGTSSAPTSSTTVRRYPTNSSICAMRPRSTRRWSPTRRCAARPGSNPVAHGPDPRQAAQPGSKPRPWCCGAATTK